MKEKNEHSFYTSKRKKLVVLGGAESGVGAAILAKKKEFSVFLSDKAKIKDKYKKVLLQNDINFEENKHTESKIINADLVIKSPGIPDKIELIKKIKLKGIKIISEIEFAAKFTDAIIVGITGSNGKTTTAMLLYHILKKSGFNVGIGGNIGKSFALQVATKSHDYYVLELSSFQLDGIENFNPNIAIITNITPDHLDRYEYNFNRYANSKFRITKNQTKKDFLIYDFDDQTIKEYIKNNKIKAKLIPFSIKKELDYGAFLKEDNIMMKLDKQELTIKLSKLSIEGKHNAKNAMAALLASKVMKSRNKYVIESMSSFEGEDHRMERVTKVNGVQYINDSKATNVNATFYALECVDNPIIWIVGGEDKGNDYFELMPLVREKVKAIICLGVNNEKIKEAFENVVDTLAETTKMKEAVKIAQKIAEKADTVLLSPACASFDLFNGYQDRGDRFKEAIMNL